jgi:hypothetical protein
LGFEKVVASTKPHFAVADTALEDFVLTKAGDEGFETDERLGLPTSASPRAAGGQKPDSTS